MIGAGDLVHVVVCGDSEAEVSEVLTELSSDAESRQYLTPVPVRVAGREDREFGTIELIQEFIVSAGSGVTVEAVVAAVRAVLRRHANKKEKGEPQARHTSTRITVRPLDEGSIELAIEIERADQNE